VKKKGGKGNKKQTEKGRKDNKKTETQKGEKGRIKRKRKSKHKKAIKEKESKIKVLTHELLASTLPYLMLTPW
jgi:hypothetical protein